MSSYLKHLGSLYATQENGSMLVENMQRSVTVILCFKLLGKTYVIRESGTYREAAADPNHSNR